MINTQVAEQNVADAVHLKSLLTAVVSDTEQRPAVELLQFTVRVVDNEQALAKAVAIRQKAYARHLPEFAESLHTPESADYAEDVVVLLAESKLDGTPLGTVRLQANILRPLPLEQSVTLPDFLQNRRLAEATRLAVMSGAGGSVVKSALVKGIYQFCQKMSVDFAVVAGRAPIDRQYERLLFTDVFPGGGFIPMSHASNIPHRVMATEISTLEARARAKNHWMGTFFPTQHPDIQVNVQQLQEKMAA
jgi:hypothetical protein